jgi:hypothetical protein
LKDGNQLGEEWKVRAKQEASMTLKNIKTESSRESQIEFCVLTLANVGLIALSMLGLTLYWHIVRMFR